MVTQYLEKQVHEEKQAREKIIYMYILRICRKNEKNKQEIAGNTKNL